MPRADKALPPFLAFTDVPDDLWQLLEPSQRELHALWTKKFAPLYESGERVQDQDLSPRDRQVIGAMLDAIAFRRLPFQRPVNYRTTGGDVTFLHARGQVLGESMAFEIIAAPSALDSETPPRISLHAHGATTEIDIILEWRPQVDPQRGSILLYPQAAKSRRRFGIAAYNRLQFGGICRALIEYCATSNVCKPKHSRLSS
jgi:hypothetical protein